MFYGFFLRDFAKSDEKWQQKDKEKDEHHKPEVYSSKGFGCSISIYSIVLITSLRICFMFYKEKDEHYKPEDKNSVYENSHTKIK